MNLKTGLKRCHVCRKTWVGIGKNILNAVDVKSRIFSEKTLLLRFLKTYDFDIEKAKELLVLNLEMRNKNPILFLQRDVLSEKFQQTFKTIQVCPLPLTTVENYKVSIFRLIDSDPNKYDYTDVSLIKSIKKHF